MTESEFNKEAASSTIYGLITVLAVLFTMDDHPPTPLSAAATIIGTVLAVALAELYSEGIAETIAHKKLLTYESLREGMRSTRPLFASALAPTLAVLLSGLGLYSVEDAITLAKVIIYITLFVYGLRIGRHLHAGRSRVLLSGLAALSIGLLVGGVKAGFH